MSSKPSETTDTAASTIVKEGWLLKADPGGSNWKHRWCVLIPSAFFYYAEHDKKDANLKGSFELAEAKLGVGWRLNRKLANDKKFVFHLQLPGRTYYFAATTQAQMNDWVSKIEKTLAALQKRVADDALTGMEHLDVDPHESYGRLPGRGATTMPAIVESPEEMGSMEDGAGVGNVSFPQTPGNPYTLKGSLAARYQQALRPHASDEASTGTAERLPAAEAESTFSFNVLAGGPGYEHISGFEAQKCFTLNVKASKRKTFTVKHIKQRIAQATGIDASRMTLTFDQDHFELADDMTAEVLDLREDVPLRVSIAPEAFQQPRLDEGEEEEEEEASADARQYAQEQASRAPVAEAQQRQQAPAAEHVDERAEEYSQPAEPPAASQPPRPQPAAAQQQAQPQQQQQQQQPSRVDLLPVSSLLPTIQEVESSDDRGSSTSLPMYNYRPPTPERSPRVYVPATASSADKRQVLYALFAGLAMKEQPSLRSLAAIPQDVRVNRTDLAANLAADRFVVSWPEYDDVIRKVIAPEGPATLSFGDLSDMYREAVSARDISAIDRSGFLNGAAQQQQQRPPSALIAPFSNTPSRSSPPAPPRGRGVVVPTLPLAGAVVEQKPANYPSNTNAPANTNTSNINNINNNNTGGHLMIMTVDLPSGATEELNITISSDAEELAADFVTRHGLESESYRTALVSEIRKVQLTAYSLVVDDLVAAKNQAEHKAAANNASSSPASAAVGDEVTAAKNSNAVLVGRIQGAEAEIALLRQRLEQSEQARADAEQQRADMERLAADAERARRDAVHSRNEAERAKMDADEAIKALKIQLAALTAECTALKEDLGSSRVASAQHEEVQRKEAWLRHVDGGDRLKASASTPMTGSYMATSWNDWRAWAAEKREILARANADRAALIEENKRLRASLDIRGVEAEARLRTADEDRARLTADLHALNTARHKAEAELRSVYKQWEEDGRRWATERKQLADQLEHLLAASVNTSFAQYTSSSSAIDERKGGEA